MSVSANIARHLAAYAAAHPAQIALKIPRGRRGGQIDYLTLSYAELSAEVAAQRRRLKAAGLQPGERTLVMVRQGLPLITVVFALFELGALPIVIDPGMGRQNFLCCVARSRPRALVGIPSARLVSFLFRSAFRSVERRISVSGATSARLTSVGATRPADDAGAIVRLPSDPAAILFTSGSTGSPKGVCYEHGHFDAQVRLIRETYQIEPGEIDLPLLPLFALFAPALGLTTIVPELDPSRPAQAAPARLVAAILQEKVTTSFGSPTLWANIAAHCQLTGQVLPSLRRVLCAGAPVPPSLWESLGKLMPNGILHSPYGATEALPVSTLSAPELIGDTALATLQGAGTCVGRVLHPNTVHVIAPHEGVLSALDQARLLPVGEIGEIIVAGPSVTSSYDDLPEATATAKIQGASTSEATGKPIFHRLGDLGYFDAVGRLWFVGRKAEVVRTIRGPVYPAQVEPLFDIHPHVRRSALVGVGPSGKHRPCLVIEPISSDHIRTSADRRQFTRELRQIAISHVHTKAIKTFYFHETLPVDVRHNAKIHRLALAKWASDGAVGYESDPKR